MVGGSKVIEMCRLLECGKSISEIAREIGISRQYVQRIVGELVCEGIVWRQNNYGVRADYKEVLKNGQKKSC